MVEMVREYLPGFAGELLGTFILVFFGISAVAVSVLFSAFSGLFQVAMVWGIGVFLAIYCTRHLSCAHLNPAVSLAMVLAKRMEIKKLPVYWLAQVIGGFLAAVLLYLLFANSIASFEQVHHLVRGDPNSLQTAMIFGDYFPNPGMPASVISVSYLVAFFVEAVGTFLLVTTIFLLTEGCNVGGPPSSLAPVMVGLTVTVIIATLAPLTMAGLNPARDFGPRLFAYLAGWGRVAIPGPSGGVLIIYILGPLAGGVVAALLFTWIWEPLMQGMRVVCTCEEISSRPAEAEVLKKGGYDTTI
jgi:glycerol uptake facilitator protein